MKALKLSPTFHRQKSWQLKYCSNENRYIHAPFANLWHWTTLPIPLILMRVKWPWMDLITCFCSFLLFFWDNIHCVPGTLHKTCSFTDPPTLWFGHYSLIPVEIAQIFVLHVLFFLFLKVQLLKHLTFSLMVIAYSLTCSNHLFTSVVRGFMHWWQFFQLFIMPALA